MHISKELVWVLVDNKLHNVSAFAHIKSHDRPTAFCPKCNSRVILKLGNVRRHHYAHIDDVECKFISAPETILHYNTKMYFKEILQKYSALYIETDCIDWECTNKIRYTWFSNWDEVKVEFRIDSKKSYIIADVALIQDDFVQGIIEVYVTHNVDENKISFIDEKFIRCLEFEATDEFVNESEHWTPDTPLPYMNVFPKLKDKRCDYCEIKYQEWLRKVEEQNRVQKIKNAKQAKIAKKLEEKRKKELEAQRLKKVNAQRNRTVITAITIIDFYYHSGKRNRQRFMLQRKYKDNIWIGARIITTKGNPLFKETGNPIEKQHIDILTSKLKTHVETIKKDKKIVFECHIIMNWDEIAQSEQPPNMIAQTYDLYCLPKYIFDLDKKTWIINPNKLISL